MQCFYIIWQLVPDPIADERANFGVTVFDDDRIRSRFVQDWTRLELFAGHSIQYAKSCALEIRRANLKGLLIPSVRPRAIDIKDDAILLAESLTRSVQVSRPRGSIGPFDDVLTSTAKLFLKS